MEQILFEQVNIVFSILIISLAVGDILSSFTGNHKDFKNSIVGLGLLGTFLGIFLGLQDFNPNQIQESIPPLLEGLKTAFWTSILGMSVSMFLSIFELLFLKKDANKDELSFLREINENIAPLQMTIDRALENISEGATSEIVSALSQIVQTFNQNLTEQFGDNFSKLNDAVVEMVLWQDKYKEIVERTHKALQDAVVTLKASKEAFDVSIKAGDNFDQALKKINTTNEQFQNSFNLLNETNEKFDLLYSNITNELKKMEDKISESLFNLTERNKSFCNSIDRQMSKAEDFTRGLNENIESVVTEYKESLEVVNKINKDLPRSLVNLGGALTALTEQFKDDYELFLEKIRKLTKEWHQE